MGANATRDKACCAQQAPAVPHGPSDRTSKDSIFRIRCAARVSDEVDHGFPVKLVVFDLDETLTLVTFMTQSGEIQPHEVETSMKLNFESPWVKGSRLVKLRNMLEALKNGRDGQQRTLAILTKNSSKAGVPAILNLLKAANLMQYFCAVWAMPWKNGRHNGAYRKGNDWCLFDPPIDKCYGHKADALHHVVKNPALWFPQLKTDKAEEYSQLHNMKLEGVVLVDDQRANFQSETGLQVLRYCKVARYDAEFYKCGLVKDMGGLGAHTDMDYDMLVRFVEDPWMCKETLQVRCQERYFEGRDKREAVQLIVFDFDETLTLATFMPKDEACRTKLDWSPPESSKTDWTRADLVTFNFESPWAPHGSRVAKLAKMLAELSKKQRLAILTRNPMGAVAVLNLLRVAKLADYFQAIWAMSSREGSPHGVYLEGGHWKVFDPPVKQAYDHKAEVLKHVRLHPQIWFPQLAGDQKGKFKDLEKLSAESIVLVDDERANFRSDAEDQTKVLRYCKVARYDASYRDCGLLNQMGGLGAHSDEDYDNVRKFVEQPWEYPYEPTPGVVFNKDGKEETPSSEADQVQMLDSLVRQVEPAEQTSEVLRGSRRRLSEPALPEEERDRRFSEL
eukprot:TRINITY_DN17938_c0_g1_i1.p1 TRINITY_DN17938_c0_g1~~TRINITY_DN17938_c0_g1_i1.p1  ORF type:complete len:619 (-),score=139.89 TRINITY_DN17938_c0_g1_i1:273-2129(-)